MSSVYFDPAVGGDGSTVSDDSNPSTGLANGGHRTRFVPAMANIVGVGTFALNKATAASSSATLANAWAVQLVTPVSGGEYSAKYHAQAAASSSSSASGYATTAQAWAVQLVTPVSGGEYSAKYHAQAAAASASSASTSAAYANTFLPSQPGNAGKFLSTDGSGPSWQLPIPDQSGNAGNILTTNGSVASWAARYTYAGVVSRSSNVALTASDSGKLVDITSGTFTQTFVAAATLGSAWYCYLRNSGTGDITLDPNASELIDGLTSYVMYPGEVRLVMCDGSGFKTIVLSAYYRAFTSSGTWTKPPGYAAHSGLLWGGGGGGSKCNLATGGGGGGSCVPFLFKASDLSSSHAVTIGAGGSAGGLYGVGGAGGSSSFGTVTAYGGGGANGVSGGGTGGSGGGSLSSGVNGESTGSVAPGGKPQGTAQTIVAPGTDGFGGGAGTDGAGGDSAYGGGGGGYTSGGKSVFGGGGGGGNGVSGASVFGGNGGAGAYGGSANAGDGVAPGGGGGSVGGNGTGAAGSGARGEFRIWGVI